MKESNACMATGVVSEDNISFANGKIFLSREAAQNLVNNEELFLVGVYML